MEKETRVRGALKIPSFASERCRAMTAEVLRILEGIAPTDDTALEDRALACFVVACGELAVMSDTAQRDSIIAQMSAAARNLVDAAAPIPARGVAKDHPEETVAVPEGELAKPVGLPWEQLEAELKRKKAKETPDR